MPKLDAEAGSARPAKKRGVVASAWIGVQGVYTAWREERSFRYQALGMVAMVAVLIILRPEPLWWALALLSSLLVLTVELINSALEVLIDHLHPTVHPAIKKAKDMSAGSVIVCTLGVACVGIIMILDSLG